MITPEVRGVIIKSARRISKMCILWVTGIKKKKKKKKKNCLLPRLREGAEPAVDMSSNREIVSLHAFQF